MASRRQLKGLPLGAVNSKNEPVCGAWYHGKDDYCQAQPMDNGRCELHGGFNSDCGKRNPKLGPADGLYSKFLNIEEANIYGLLKIGTLEQELKLLRIQLMRAINAQHNWEISQEKLQDALKTEEGTSRTPDEVFRILEIEAYELKRQEGVDNRGQPVDQVEKKVTHRKNDFKAEMRSLITLISKLEGQHHELMKSDIPDSEKIAQIADDLRRFAAAAQGSIPKPKE